MPRVVAQACNPSTGEAGVSQIQGQSRPHIQFQVSLGYINNTLSQKEKNRIQEL
jgi:hypothetical protein